MEDIRIPSPSAILAPSPPAAAPALAPAAAARRSDSRLPRPTTSAAPAGEPARDRPAAAQAKPKQSKSRNGCLTCKVKRLKCDESKPTCQQCRKRNVPCGGYKKEFKWRPFEECNRSAKSACKGKKVAPPAPRPVENSLASLLTPPATERSTPPPWKHAPSR